MPLFYNSLIGPVCFTGEKPLDLPPLQILMEDNHCLAINKPAGALTTGYEGGEETLDRQVKAYLKTKYDKPGNVFLGVVHRLDRPVSGVLMYARTSKGAARLAEQFREGEVTKTYWAIVHGKLEPNVGTWENWLWKDNQQGIVQTVKFGTPDAKLARLSFQVLAQTDEYSFVAVYPKTGRTHQIRVQFASRGFPIVGDHKYGSKEDFAGSIALHAHSLLFKHPISYEETKLSVPPPITWARFNELLETVER